MVRSISRRGRPALLLALALLVAGCASSGAPPPPPGLEGFERAAPARVGLSAERLARLDRLLDGYVERGELPGYQLLVARRGKLVHARMAGHRDLEAGQPVTPDTIFRIYSMSKVVTGIATMIAFEEGHFELGEPVAKYLPALADPEVWVQRPDGSGEAVPAERPITIRDLLRHTSGISYSFMAPPPLREQYLAAGLTPGLRGVEGTPLAPGDTEEDADLAEMVERLGRIPLVSQPGSAWHYGINQDVLGRLIEVVSATSFPEFLESRLFAPLGMRDAGFFVPDEKLDRLAACYASTPEGGIRLLDAPETSPYRVPPAMPGGGGGMVASGPGYLRFAMMLAGDGVFDGRRILSRKTIDMIMSNQLPPQDFGPAPLGFAAGRNFANDGRGIGFGLTGFVVTDPALAGVAGSRGAFGWGGAASTFFWVDREEELAVVFMTQRVLSGDLPLRAQLQSGVNTAIVD